MNPFTRTEWLLGEKAVKKLAKCRVAVFGVGGVGSYAAEGLARSGVGNIVLVDHANVKLTNFNRQIHATVKTLNRPKVEAMKERILDINPSARVAAYKEFFTADLADKLMSEGLDYIVDAIDTVPSKIQLIEEAKKRRIPIISSMGAGNKLDPTKFKVGDIYDTSVCPLARVMRRELKKRNVESLKVVFSTEQPISPMYGEENEDEPNGETVALPQDKKNPPGSVSFVPPVAGLIIAAEVVKDLALSVYE